MPWQIILSQAPALISAATELLTKSRRWSADIATTRDLDALRGRCAELARDQQEYAELVKRLTEQLDAVSGLIDATAKRARLAVVVGGVGLAAGIVGCALALLR
jgi:hypothetical protein